MTFKMTQVGFQCPYATERSGIDGYQTRKFQQRCARMVDELPLDRARYVGRYANIGELATRVRSTLEVREHYTHSAWTTTCFRQLSCTLVVPPWEEIPHRDNRRKRTHVSTVLKLPRMTTIIHYVSPDFKAGGPSGSLGSHA